MSSTTQPGRRPSRPTTMGRLASVTFIAAAALAAVAACATPTATGSGSPQRTITREPSPSVTAAPSNPTPSDRLPTPPSSTSTRGATGIQGTVVTQRCPVMPAEGCPLTPVQAHVVVMTSTGSTVASADSDAQGHFRLNVGPGTYMVRASVMSGVLPRPAATTVTVRAGNVVTVTLQMDSGIR